MDMRRRRLPIDTSAFTIVELLIVIVVIGVLAAIIIISYKGITDSAKTATMKADVADWKHASETYKIQHGIECPSNFVFVYGNSTLGTSDFCVAKYEMKVQGVSDGANGYGTGSCTAEYYSTSMVAESRADGTPWVCITPTHAVTVSQSQTANCSDCHLMTEAEWMTIAADIMSVKYNWSGGEVGSGYISTGHSNDNPASGLAASIDDSNGLYGMTGGYGTTAGSNDSRVLILSSGDYIWDFSGNIWESTQVALGTLTQTSSHIGVSGDSGLNWREYTLGTLSLGNLPTVSKPNTLASVNGLSGITGWDSSNGIGEIYANYADTTAVAFSRGGRWNSGASAGLLSLNMGNSATVKSTYIGFRVVK